MNAQKNGPLVSVAAVAAGSLIGVWIAAHLTSGPGMLRPYSIGDGVRDWLILSAGAILGGLLFSWASRK